MGGVTGGLLLDTHVLLWMLAEPARLSPVAREAVEERSTPLYVSSASAWEISTKHRLGRLPQAEAIIAGYERHLDRAGVETIAIDNQHSLLGGALAWPHRDPFDRVIAATAMVQGLPLVTADETFRTLNGVRVVW